MLKEPRKGWFGGLDGGGGSGSEMVVVCRHRERDDELKLPPRKGEDMVITFANCSEFALVVNGNIYKSRGMKKRGCGEVVPKKGGWELVPKKLFLVINSVTTVSARLINFQG